MSRTKGQLAGELVARAQTAGIGFRALVADCFYGPGESPHFIAGLEAAAHPVRGGRQAEHPDPDRHRWHADPGPARPAGRMVLTVSSRPLASGPAPLPRWAY
ncbi:hypothetical protein ACFOY2_53030 [Nonomuraea purpurea]|uniref:Transposase IS701-like DDE domain-containing protein n=1 Tax=Nonomuraea purpurea TaxID=1849276 RepID=A0ABV8GUU9_9ACTN